MTTTDGCKPGHHEFADHGTLETGPRRPECVHCGALLGEDGEPRGMPEGPTNREAQDAFEREHEATTEQRAREHRMFGCRTYVVHEYVEQHDTPHDAAMSLLSDAQEEMALAQMAPSGPHFEFARVLINRAKYAIEIAKEETR